VVVQIACNRGRTAAQKQLLYRCVAQKLTADPGLRPQDVSINLRETARENGSFGNGVAQYA
jgi:hypothetical protein